MCRRLPQATLIPQADDIERFEVSENLEWVLVVEKEVKIYSTAASCSASALIIMQRRQYSRLSVKLGSLRATIFMVRD